MDSSIALILIQDGIVNGAIYALLAIALVLVFAVTRIVFIPQGEFVAYGALTLAMLQHGQAPLSALLLLAGGAVALTMDAWAHWRGGRLVAWRESLLWYAVLPIALAALAFALDWQSLPHLARMGLAIAIVAAMGPITFRIFYQPVAEASVLVLLIVSVAVHLAFSGLGLLMFGAEGYRTEPLWDARFELGPLLISGQSLWVLGASLALIAALALFFTRTLYGKALRAAAVNRNGARLMGISPNLAGRLTLLLAAAIGATSGVLVSPITTIYYDSGFLIGLKGFVAAIIGGLASFPIAAAGSLLVGLLESFSSFWASAFKEVIVFTLIIPVLLWRSLTTHHVEEE